MSRNKILLKTKRRIFIVGCIVCMMFSTVAFAKTYVGNLPTQTVSNNGLTVNGNASYTYGVLKDKLYCYATLGGEDAGDTTMSGPFNGMKMTTNYDSSICKAKVYDSKRSCSSSKDVDTDNTYATVEFYTDGSCRLEIQELWGK